MAGTRCEIKVELCNRLMLSLAGPSVYLCFPTSRALLDRQVRRVCQTNGRVQLWMSLIDVC